MVEFPPLGRDNSSTLRELWGVLTLSWPLVFAGGPHQVWVVIMVMETHCCVFITGCVVPPFAVARRPASAGSVSSSQDHPNFRCRPWW